MRREGECEMLLEKVRDVIVETLGCEAEDVKPEASLTEDLGADSLAFVELVIALEDATGIHIEEEEASQLKTVADVVAYLEAKQQ